MTRSICLAAALLLYPGLVVSAPAWQTQTIAPAQADQNMQVMAVVNGQQITRSDLARETARRFGETVIENMINNQLILEQCKAQGIQVSAEDIHAELERCARSFVCQRTPTSNSLRGNAALTRASCETRWCGPSWPCDVWRLRKLRCPPRKSSANER